MRKIILVLLLACLSISASPVFADGYWGIGVGNASLDLKPVFGTEELEDAAMLKVILGNRTGNFALEMDIAAGSFDWVGSTYNSHTVAVVSGAMIGFWSINETLEFFAKFGVNTSSTSVDYLGSLYEGDSGFGITYGAGVMINFSNSFALRGEYQGITGIDDGVDSGYIEWFSVQAVFGF